MSERIKESLGDELYAQVVEKLGDKKIDFLDNYIPKTRFEDKVQEVNSLKDQIGSLENSTTEMEKLVGQNKDVQAELEKVKQDYEAAKTKHQKDNETRDKTTLLKEGLSKAGAVYTDPLLKMVDLDNIELKDGKIRDLETHIDPLRETYKGMFKEVQLQGSEPNQGNGLGLDNNNLQQQQNQEKLNSGSLSDRISAKNAVFKFD